MYIYIYMFEFVKYMYIHMYIYTFSNSLHRPYFSTTPRTPVAEQYKRGTTQPEDFYKLDDMLKFSRLSVCWIGNKGCWGSSVVLRSPPANNFAKVLKKVPKYYTKEESTDRHIVSTGHSGRLPFYQCWMIDLVSNIVRYIIQISIHTYV